MANNLIYCVTRIKKELPWKIKSLLYWLEQWKYIHWRDPNQQFNTDTSFLPPRKAKAWTTSSHVYPHPFWIAIRKSQVPSYSSYLAFLSTATSLGILTGGITLGSYFHLSCISDVLQFDDPGCWQQPELFQTNLSWFMKQWTKFSNQVKQPTDSHFPCNFHRNQAQFHIVLGQWWP